MGFWGSFVLARAEQESLLDLPPVTSRSEGLEEEVRLGDWRLGRFEGPELAQDAGALLADLVAATGAPALTAFVLDSDAVVVDGLSAAGPWRACLAREAMRGYCEDDGEDFGIYPSATAAAAAAADWAREAGCTPDEQFLERVFATDEADLFAEDLFTSLLQALGLTGPAEGWTTTAGQATG